MKSGSGSTRFLAAAAFFALCLPGCQDAGRRLANLPKPQDLFAFQKAPKMPSAEPVKLNDRQKADVQMVLGRSLEKQGQSDQAIRVYQEVTRKDRQRADAYHRLAVLHGRKGDAKPAETYYRQALQRDPRNAEIHCDLGYHYYLMRRWAEAERSLREAIRLKPTLARAHTNLGLVLAQNGHINSAVEQFRLAGAGESGARCNVAFILMLGEEWAEAQQQFERALAADPESKAAKAGLATLDSMRLHAGNPQWATSGEDGGSVRDLQATFVAGAPGDPGPVRR